MIEWQNKGDGVAYLQFVERQSPYIEHSVAIPDTGIVLDFTNDDELVGIETHNAEQDLPKEILAKFDEKSGSDTKPSKGEQ